MSANTPAFVMYPGNPRLDYGPAATNIRHAGALNGTWQLPPSYGLLASPIAKQFVDGWSLSGIATLQSGFPLSPQLGYNPTGNGDTRNPARPNRAAGFSGPLYAKTVKQWFNPAAFSAPYPGTFGNIGRDTLTGPGLSELDLALAKSTTIHERLRAQFRAEFFNVLNHTNFGIPNTTSTSASFGQIRTTYPARQIQFALKVIF